MSATFLTNTFTIRLFHLEYVPPPDLSPGPSPTRRGESVSSPPSLFLPSPFRGGDGGGKGAGGLGPIGNRVISEKLVLPHFRQKFRSPLRGERGTPIRLWKPQFHAVLERGKG